jgi:hypothetical protein
VASQSAEADFKLWTWIDIDILPHIARCDRYLPHVWPRSTSRRW